METIVQQGSPLAPPASPPMGAARGAAVLFIQDGARLHYAIPVALKRAGLLGALYAGWYNHNTPLARAMVRLAGLFSPRLAQRMQERYCAELVGCKIVDSKFTEVAAYLLVRMLGWRSSLLRPIWAVQRRKMLRVVLHLSARDHARVAFGFSHCLSPLAAAAYGRRGVPVVLDQPTPSPAEWLRVVTKLRAAYGAWATGLPRDSDLVAESLRFRALAGRVDLWTCPSEYTRDSLVSERVEPSKIRVLPYPLDLSHFGPAERGGGSRPVRVGFVGRVTLLKGAPYFLEAAKLCDPALVKFTMVGHVGLTDFGRKHLEERVELVGSVPRSQILDWLKRFDIFFFPSTCEGSAGAVMEAMATGLPIVASPNSGSVVREGIDGYIVDYDKPELAAQRLMELAQDKELRLRMGRSAHERANAFNIDYYSREIAGVIGEVVGGRRGSAD